MRPFSNVLADLAAASYAYDVNVGSIDFCRILEQFFAAVVGGQPVSFVDAATGDCRVSIGVCHGLALTDGRQRLDYLAHCRALSRLSTVVRSRYCDEWNQINREGRSTVPLGYRR